METQKINTAIIILNWNGIDLLKKFLPTLIAKSKNANIINIFTKQYGKVSGIVYGGNSRKIRNFLQISNKIFVFHNIKD